MRAEDIYKNLKDWNFEYGPYKIQKNEGESIKNIIATNIPKDPVQEVDVNGERFLVCPMCDREVKSDFNYCPACGQLVKHLWR